jgi:hypothetical protein
MNLIAPIRGKLTCVWPLIVVAAFTTTAHAQLKPRGLAPPEVEIGSQVILTIRGEVASEYARRSGAMKRDEKAPKGLSIQMVATVSQRLKNNQYRIDLSDEVEGADGKQRLITLSTIADAGEIKERNIPKGLPVYDSPADAKNGVKPVRFTEDRKELWLELSNLKAAKFQTWSLVE